MGCRPSRHSLGKVGDSTWEYNKVYMNGMDKKKHKSKRSGRGRGRKHPTYSDFSSTSKTYYNNTECKSSKITVRLSTDGSMLEIETFDMDMTASQSVQPEVGSEEICSNQTLVNVHTSRANKRATLQRCESAPELIGKSSSEPVVWKSSTKVPNTDNAPGKFTCIETHEHFYMDDGTVLTEVGETELGDREDSIHTDITKNGRSGRAKIIEDTIATPEADQICDMFLKKAMIRENMGDYKCPDHDSPSHHSNKLSYENKRSSCEYRSNKNEYYDNGTINSESERQSIINSERFPFNKPCMCRKCQLNAGHTTDPQRALCCETLTYIVLYGTPTGAPTSSCCCLCPSANPTNHIQHLSPFDTRATSATDRLQPVHAGPPYRCGPGAPFIHEQTNSHIRTHAQPVSTQSTLLIDNIDRFRLQNPNDVSSKSEPISRGMLCTSSVNTECQVPLLNNLLDLSSLPTNQYSDKSHICDNNPRTQLNTCNFNDSISMTIKDQQNKDNSSSRKHCDCMALGVLDNRTSGYTNNENPSSRRSWTDDDAGELCYDSCEEYRIDGGPVHYNMDYLDVVSEGDMEDEQSGDEYEYESSEKDDEVDRVELQDPFDNIPKITRAYEGYSVIYDDEDDNSCTDEDDSSEEVYIDAVESSYV